MSIRLAIHHNPGSFSERWIDYCSRHRIAYKIVNCYDFNIMCQLKAVDGLLWHWLHFEPSAQLVAKQILASAELQGIKVFPNMASCWHYDDKIGQKFLLESIGAPLIPSYVFFNQQEASNWINNAEFPKVFKLRCGAGSQNVRLVKTKKEARKLCDHAFAEGFAAVNGYFADAKTKVRAIKGFDQLIEKLKRIPQSLQNISLEKRFLPMQKGYIYFQDFLPGNTFDTRITVIGKRAFGFLRKTRPHDFRASGSGNILYNHEHVDKGCIQIAFETAAKLKTQSLAFDFLFDQNAAPQIAEISYSFQNKAIYNCSGYWDDHIEWHEGHFWPEDVILMDFLQEISSEKMAAASAIQA